MKKRLISLLLAFSMMLTFLPAGAVSAFAEGTADDTSKGTVLENGASITTGGVYRLQGPYTLGIEIKTSDPVIINIAAGDEVTFEPTLYSGRPIRLLEVVTNSDLTVNNYGTYTGSTFLHTSKESVDAKVTIHGGSYNIESSHLISPCAFNFEAGGFGKNPIVVDDVHIEAGSSSNGIYAGSVNAAAKVQIKNSTINVSGLEHYGGAINVNNRQTSVILDDVTAQTDQNSAIQIVGGNLTINSGCYTSNKSTAVCDSRNDAYDVSDVTINGGKFIGNSPYASTLSFGEYNSILKIHGGTFTSTKYGQVLYNIDGQVTIDNAVEMPKFYSEGGTADAIKNDRFGRMKFDDGIIRVSGGSDRAALSADGAGTSYSSTSITEINGGKIIGAKYGIRVWRNNPNVILKDVQFENNGTDIYLYRNYSLDEDQKITIEETFKRNATIDCEDPEDGRQLTTSTTGTDYQKNLKLTSANKGYLVDYKKTTDGQEYRCFSKKVGVTISGLEGSIKAEDPAEFTVTLDHAGSTGIGTLTFGDKNGEIEYKDENDKYQLMPKDGLPIGLGDAKDQYAFRITPKNAGEQTLTAAVVRDDVKLGTAEKNFTVAGRVHTTVTIEGLENAVIKEGESKDFTVKVDPKDDAGKGKIDFGGKNGEVQYKDGDDWKDMPADGLEIDLDDGAKDYEFRITPKETGKQTLTAAVKQGENELAKDEKDFVVSEMPILTLKDGVITSVTVPGKDGADPEDITEIVKKNANEDGSFNVPEGATVSVAFDKDAFADSGLKFGHWDITGLDDPNAYQNKESFDFKMPAKAVTLKAMTQDASIEDDEPDIVGPIVIGTTVVVGGAVLGYQAYSLGAEFAGKLMALPYFPSNRSALAMMLWEDAGKPMPESELLYPDVGQEERDMDLQHAARWAMENELIPDLNDEGTAPEEMKFYPDNTVSKIDVLKAWQKAQELKQNA